MVVTVEYLQTCHREHGNFPASLHAAMLAFCAQRQQAISEQEFSG
jgi:hypothetical protein